MGAWWRWLVAVSGICVASTWGESSRIHFQEDFEKGLGTRWKPVKFHEETQHTIQKEGTNAFLQAKASGSASGLAVELSEISPQGKTFSWRWRIDRVPPGGSEDVKKTFDHTARVFVAFKTFLGPPRTINYVWANETPVDQTFHHPSSGRSRFIVLQNGNERAGKWISESRDISADWKRLFGKDDVPPIVGIGFMTDADGTRSTVTGNYDDFVLWEKKGK